MYVNLDRTLAELRDLERLLRSAVRRASGSAAAERSLLARGLAEIHAALMEGLRALEAASMSWQTELILSSDEIGFEIEYSLDTERTDLTESRVPSPEFAWSLVSL